MDWGGEVRQQLTNQMPSLSNKTPRLPTRIHLYEGDERTLINTSEDITYTVDKILVVTTRLVAFHPLVPIVTYCLMIINKMAKQSNTYFH